MKTRLKTSSENRINILLNNNNFRNNQNYTFKHNFKKNIRFKIKVGILTPKIINGQLNNFLGYKKYKYINIFKIDNILDIKSEKYYIKQYFGYLLLLIFIGFFTYFIKLFGILLFGYIFFLYYKRYNLINEIKQLQIFLDGKNIITINSNNSKFIDDKIKLLDNKEIISENKINKDEKYDLNNFIFNKNLLNNQNYVFGRKMKNIVKAGMFTSVGKGKYKKVVKKSIIGLNIEEYRQDLQNIIGFSKKKEIQYISYKYIVDNVGNTNGGLKALLIFATIISSPFTLIPLMFIFGFYGLLIQLMIFIGVIYFLYFHKYKFKGFGDFKVIYDKDLIFFIKKKSNMKKENKSHSKISYNIKIIIFIIMIFLLVILINFNPDILAFIAISLPFILSIGLVFFLPIYLIIKFLNKKGNKENNYK